VENDKNSNKSLSYKKVGRDFKPLKSNSPAEFSYNSLGIKRTSEIDRLFVANLDGRPHVLSWKDDSTLLATPSDLNRFLGMTHKGFRKTTFYVISKQGKLIYTNDLSIREADLVKRELVQKFIAFPINTGQVKVRDKKKGNMFGFYQEVKGTNLVLFGETQQSVLFDQMFQVAKKFFLVSILILVFTIVAIQWPLRRIINPIRELLQSAIKVSRGDFNIEARQKSFGELSILSFAFSDMANSLAARDKALEKMFEDRQERNRLEFELINARNIQTNLLPRREDMGGPNIEVEGLYVPASECAGDWFQQHYDARNGKYYIVIADVSGHGAASSMFTTVIATLFHEWTREGRFVVKDFFESVHHCMQTIGRHKWHASCQVMEIDVSNKTGVLHNCGHIPPVLVSPKEKGRKRMKKITAPSMLLGLDGAVEHSTKEFSLASGDCILLMTDGLIEAESQDGEMYGFGRLKSFIKKQSDYSPKGCVNDLIIDMKSHMGPVTAKDDVCVLCLRVA
jgi:serine phosphatase RsbU (regulator of sigma subunit)